MWLSYKTETFISVATAFAIMAVMIFIPLQKTGSTMITNVPTAEDTSAIIQSSAAAQEITAETVQKTYVPTQYESEKPFVDSSLNIIELGNSPDGEITIGFAGDINLDEKWKDSPMQFYKPGVNNITDFIDPVLVNKMKAADILFVNNEFTFSDRGEAQKKPYTFRANPANVSVYEELGVDAVSIANNHIFDYGETAMMDTIATLKSANIACAGAGENIDEAQKALYFRINGKVIAFVAAGRTELWLNTPAAGIGKPGILDAYGSDNCVNAIKAAEANSDFAFVYVHWGIELSHKTSTEQPVEAKRYIDAGADAVIGAHPHVLQGMDFYKEKFVAYSLGNFWFETVNTRTGFLELVIDASDNLEPRFTPCYTTGIKTFIQTDTRKWDEVLRLIESVSPNGNIVIDESGKVTAK